MNVDQLKFLASVEEFTKQNPQMMGQLIQAAQSGVTTRLQEERQRTIDMETVAAMALDAKLFKTKQWYIAELLSKWEGRTHIVFTDLVTKLRTSQNNK